MTVIELRTLGDSRIVVRGKQIGPQSPLSFALALYLAIERGRPHPREELVALLLPGVPMANAAHNLRQMLYNLRELGVPAETTPSGSMIAAADVRDDYSALLATGELPEQWADRLPGEFLPGYWPKVSDDYARWLELQRDGVNSALRRAYVRRILDRRAVARWDEVERYARACLVVDPLNEEATLALAEALALSGSKVAGVKVLEEYEREVGQTSSSLVIPAATLKKRIAERVPSVAHRSAAQPHVGREAELRQLSRLFTDVQVGIPRAIAIVGDAGIGKTRLSREFLSTIALHSVRVVEASCQPHDIRRPMSLLVDLVPQLIRCAGALGADPSSLELLRRLHQVDSEDALSAREMPARSPDDFAAIVTDALSDLLDAITSSQLLAIVIDDVHWADSLSLQVLANLTAETKRRRLMILMTARHLPPALDVAIQSALHLSGLSPNDSIKLIDALLDRSSVSTEAADRIVTLAGGNPFFLRVLADHCTQDGRLEVLPPELRDLVAQRLRGLTPTERTTLATCATLGRLATIGRLEAILELPRHALADTLASLEGLRLTSSRDGRLEVQHHLITQAIVEIEPFTRLAVVRRAAAALVEKEATSRGEIAYYWQAVDLWLSSGEPERAKDALRTCALHAATIGAATESLEAVARFSRIATEAEAIELCETIRVRVILRYRIDSRLIESWRSSRPQREQSSLVQHFDLLTYEVSRHYRGDGEQNLDDLLTLVFDPDAERLARIRAGSIAMCVADDIDDADLASAIAKELNIDDIDHHAADADHVRLLLAYHTGFGDRAEAVRIARTIATWPDDRILRGDSIRSLTNAGFALTQCGVLSESVPVLERAHQLATENALSVSCSLSAAQLCWIARQVGDPTASQRWSAKVDALTQNRGLKALDSFSLWVLTVSALDRADAKAAGALVAEVQSRVAFYSRSSHWTMFTALKLRYAALTNAEYDTTDVEDAISWSIRTAARAPEDDITLGVCSVLIRTDVRRATTYLDSYLRLRRKEVPLLPALQHQSALMSVPD